MRWTIERLRLAIVLAAVVLLLAIAGSFFYGRWRLRHVAQDLPARLGIQIQQTTQGFVLSKSDQGRKVFTLHASRAVSFKTGGRVLLHDVEIDLYNRQNDEADIIAGKDFEYDRDDQVVIAQGEAHLALHAPASANTAASNSGVGNEPGARMVYVTTHGLVFHQKTGKATCSGEVDFHYLKLSGQALGASYDSKQGHLILQSQVVLTTETQGRSAVVHAAHAVYDRDAAAVHLLEPRYFSHEMRGDEHGRAETATVFLRPDGSADRVDAQGAVELAAADGTGIRSSAMQVQLDEKSRPRQAHFLGNVQLTQNQPTQQTVGGGRDAVVDFDADGHANRVTLDGDVNFQQQIHADKEQFHRTLEAERLVLYLKPAHRGNDGKGQSGQAQLEEADATGNAVFTSENTGAGRPSQKTSLAAQMLKTKFLARNEIEHIDGAGQTRMRMVAPNGDIDTSTGDVLAIEFATGRRERTDRPEGADNALNAQSIQSAVQTGHVVLEQTSAKTTGGANGTQNSTATAERAQYDGASDTLTLTGAPVFRDASLEMTAGRFEFQRAAGKMLATGAVQTTLRSGGENGAGGMLSGNQPTHVIARQALMLHDEQKAVFTGQARLWQGDSSVEAPVIELSQKMKTLVAHGNGKCKECVRATFLAQSAGPGPQSGQTASKTGANGSRVAGDAEDGTFRVLSGRLLYSDAQREAIFSDHVEAIGSSGEIFADRAEVFLTPVGAHLMAKLTSPTLAARDAAGMGHPGAEKEPYNSSERNNVSQSSVERIVATGNIVVEQPGRRATGTRLVYTASDGRFVLTGDGAHPPRAVDSTQGTVTGETLAFSSQTQAIMVSGTPNDEVVTRTRVRKR